MNIAEYYRRQFAWRGWRAAIDALPLARGELVLDLGCGVGDLSAELSARGARVIGVDLSEELIREARSRSIANVELRLLDLRDLDLGVVADGIWSSFTAAYFPDLPTVLHSWSKSLRTGGWIALTEVDDFFGHEPVSERTRSLLEGYARDALAAKRYDFKMGGKLRRWLDQSGFAVSRELLLPDRELAFEGAALPEVIDAWTTRLDGMKLLREFCGPEYGAVRDEFLACLRRPDHRSRATIRCCIARRTA